jgi:hypothetical protein
VDADDALGVLARGADCGYRKRRGVRREHGIGGHDALELAKRVPLGVEIFDDRLDDESTLGERVVAGGRNLDAADDLLRARLVEPLLLHFASECLSDALLRSGERLGASVRDNDTMAGSGRDLGDATPHRARAEHADDGMCAK